ncbi:MAG TPA: type I-D CRISPR-associated protein Cas7/Csc2 [Ktedonobacteraceae bacterium]|nr:type I-D CRISPR-associated protein Cas7/Csc2 [Ktedonobacteraceae bacterium]
MLEQLTTLLNEHQDAFHSQVPRYRQNRYVQIVVLRETKSHAIFTTEGQTLDVERLQAGLLSRKQIDRVVMYKRKQIAPERRTGKALMRDLGTLGTLQVSSGKKAAKATKAIQPSECQIMGGSCGICPDCILYGFAATTGNGSQRARVLTDSGFVVRDLRQVMRHIKLNAIQDTIAGGIAGSAFAGRENVLPQVFMPTVETLLDVTLPEFLYVLGNILKTTRYGAESNREGFVRNHILGIYWSDVELFSNLELTQRYYDALAAEQDIPDYLDLQHFLSHWPAIESATLGQVTGRTRKMDNLAELLEGVRNLYQDENVLRSLLQELARQSKQYVETVKGKDKEADSDSSEEDAEE